MNDLSAFRRARPAMIVGRSFAGGPPPLGLGEPFALNGGDLLGADGIAFDLMHEHQPDFQRYVMSCCEALLAAERPWFRMGPLLLTGPRGAGRTHAARRVAKVAGLQHVVLNLTDPLVGASVASSGTVGEQLWASPITVAMAATRCANPIVSVIGIDRVSDDVAEGLIALIDPETGRAWSEDRLQTMIDFGEVTWIVQSDDLGRVPTSLRRQATHVRLRHRPPGFENSAALSILLEVIDDFGLDSADPRIDWPMVTRNLAPGLSTAGQLYADMADAVAAAIGGPAFDHDEIPD